MVQISRASPASQQSDAPLTVYPYLGCTKEDGQVTVGSRALRPKHPPSSVTVIVRLKPDICS